MKKRLLFLLILFVLLALVSVTGFSVAVKQWLSLVFASSGITTIIIIFLKK